VPDGSALRRALAPATLASRGEAPALAASDGGSLSYAALAERGRALATTLAALGLTPGEPVGLVSTSRGFDEAVGLVGLFAGQAVALPLDASAPAARLASMLVARGARALVLDEAGLELGQAITRAAPLVALVVQARDGEHARVVPSGASSEGAAPRPLEPGVACVLHTSGSTGTPKPVPIAWRGLDEFTAWGSELLGIAEGARVLRVAELVFDLAWLDHLATLREGATLVCASRRELQVGKAIVELFERLAPDVVYGVPGLFMKLGAALGGRPLAPAPRSIAYAGEVFPPSELAAFARVVPEARLFNFFGPTETNVCTFHELDRATLDGRETPIGRACPYARCELVDLDEPSRTLEGPATGELVVSGPTTVGGGPYRTRDRVERGEDGLFYFRGRIDRMLKVRGYRVEPGEVEATLGAHPSVQQAAVVPFDDPRLGRVLRAHVALAPGASATERELRVFAAARLPGYMVPERVLVHDELPRTATGKIDYGAL
jgi:acyl-coenzyme A synthetase/AMP-(fatty) acid ligase